MAKAAATTKPDETPAEPQPAPRAERTLAVLDPTCEPQHDGSGAGKWRVHTVVVDGKETHVKFKHGDATVVPFAVGMKFLKVADFDVRDPKTGRKLDAIPDPMQRSIGAGVDLAADQVIARLDEITSPALLMRAATLSGGERFGGNSSRDEVIAFLLEKTREKSKPAAAPKPTAMDEASDPAAGDTVPADEFDKLFGGGEEE